MAWKLSTCIKDENYSIKEFKDEQYHLNASLKQDLLHMEKSFFWFYSVCIIVFLYIISAYDVERIKIIGVGSVVNFMRI